MPPNSMKVLTEPGDGLTPQMATTDEAVLVCPAVNGAGIQADQTANVLRERSLDGSAVCVDETAATPGRDYSIDPDLVTVACFVDAVMSALGIEAGAEGSVQASRDAFVTVYAAALALPVAQLRTDAVAGVGAKGGLTNLLRTAAGVKGSGPATWEEAQGLAQRAVSRGLASLGLSHRAMTWLLECSVPGSEEADQDPDESSDYTRAGDEMWEESDGDAVDPVAFETEPDPPADDPWIAASQSSQVSAPSMISTVAVPSMMSMLRPLSRKNWKRLMKFGLPKSTRRALNEWVRTRRQAGEITRHSQADGYAAEWALLVLYLLDRNKTAAQVLAGRRVGAGSIDDVATAGSVWATIKTALLSLVTNAVGQPDILDPDLRHVYEIKPKSQAVRGAHQLYGRYLLFLNAWEVFSSIPGTPARRALAWAARVIAAFSGYVGQGSFPDVDLSGIGPVRFWTPGTWTPPRRVILLDGRLMDVEVPIPGVLCYQILGKPPSSTPNATVPVDLRTLAGSIALLFLAQAVADAANDTAGPPGLEALARSAGQAQADGQMLREGLLAAGGAATTVALAPSVQTAAASLVATVSGWLESLASVAGGVAETTAAAFFPLLIVVDPKTGMPYGMSRRYGAGDPGA